MRPNFFDFEPYRSGDECSPCEQVLVLLRAIPGLLTQWLKRVRERQELARLDHRALRDIGVTPSEIARECEKPFWRP